MTDPSDKMLKRAEQLEDDPSTDLDSRQRQEAGWFKIYVECPECKTPMARQKTEHEAESGGVIQVSRTTIRGLCPNCGKTETLLSVERKTGPTGTLDP